jgi:hypothetical protein
MRIVRTAIATCALERVLIFSQPLDAEQVHVQFSGFLPFGWESGSTYPPNPEEYQASDVMGFCHRAGNSSAGWRRRGTAPSCAMDGGRGYTRAVIPDGME